VAGAAGARTLIEAPVDPKTLRIYHVTHVDNVASILGEGALLADTAGAEPTVDVSAPDARDFRRAAPVEGADTVVADYVPFLLSTDAHVWNAVRTGTPDPRLAPEAVERQPADHVILVSSVAGAVGARTDTVGSVVVTDADAAAGGVEAASAWPDVLRMLQRLHREDDGTRLLSAEFLVRECLPLERVLLIAVGNDRVRDRVRAALDAVGLRTRVAVYPPWFQPTSDAE
jgi:ssDNA thymidine ADP-ribosyltransferase, DarT